MRAIALVAFTLCSVLGPAAYGAAQWPLGADMPKKPTSSEPGLHLTATGRFQIFISPHIKGHTFMLDTDTGRVWTLDKDSTSGNFSLKRVPAEEVDKPGKVERGPDKTETPSQKATGGKEKSDSSKK